jgi:hypothetical protein
LGVLLEVADAPDVSEGLEDHVLEGSRHLIDAAFGPALAAVTCVCRKSP